MQDFSTHTCTSVMSLWQSVACATHTGLNKIKCSIYSHNPFSELKEVAFLSFWLFEVQQKKLNIFGISWLLNNFKTQINEINWVFLTS